MPDDLKYPSDFPVTLPAAGEIHLWSFPVSPYGPYAEKREYLLSMREREKAGRFSKGENRIRSRVVYVLLREILSLYTGKAPEKIDISLSEQGKPFMNDKDAPLFNFSHSGDRVLFAFTTEQEVGVDLEMEKKNRDLGGLIEYCCSPGEIASLEILPPRERTGLFYRYWSSKEAFLKGKGSGITIPPKKVDCSSGKPIDGWTVVPLNYWPGFGASVAIKWPDPRITLITPDSPSA